MPNPEDLWWDLPARRSMTALQNFAFWDKVEEGLKFEDETPYREKLEWIYQKNGSKLPQPPLKWNYPLEQGW